MFFNSNLNNEQVVAFAPLPPPPLLYACMNHLMESKGWD
jgi:hypothetical protein